MRLNPIAFNAHLNSIGQRFQWRKAFRCPCMNPHSGAAKPGCPQCGGKSWLWAPPVDATAGIAGQKVQRQWAMFGLWQDGDMVVTIGSDSPMYDMGQTDRVLMLNSTDYFSVPLVRGGANERLFDPIKAITRVFWLDQAGDVVEGGRPAIAADGTLTWPAGGEPPAGSTYSITGTRYTEMFCWGQFPSDRNEHGGAKLPKRVVLRRFDLFGRDLNQPNA